MKHFILAFVLALVGYAACYLGIEHWRARKGPWRVTFTQSPAHAPVITIDQPSLAIAHFQIIFTNESLHASNAPGAFPADLSHPYYLVTDHSSPGTTLLFAEPRSVPYEVPFGRCVFLDLSSLPGTVTFDLFGHEIQLLPRVLIIDRQEYPWRHDAAITLHPAPATPKRAQPAPQ
jgi:hypothetical protein